MEIKRKGKQPCYASHQETLISLSKKYEVKNDNPDSKKKKKMTTIYNSTFYNF